VNAMEIKKGCMTGIYLSEPSPLGHGWLITEITLSGATVKQIRWPKTGSAENIAQDGAQQFLATSGGAHGGETLPALASAV